MAICQHEIDPETLEYHKKYGRIGRCKKCGCKMYLTRFIKQVNKKPPRTS